MHKNYFAVSQYPSNKVSTAVRVAAYILAGLIVVMVTAQLITYEKFIPLLENYQIGNTALMKAFAAILIIVSVMSLPFLMRMSLSPLLRLVSAGCCLLFSGMWLFLGVWDVIYHPPTVGAGLLGGLLGTIIPSGVVVYVAVLLVFWSVVMLILLRKDFKR